MRVQGLRFGGLLLAATMLSGVPGVSLHQAQAQSAAERQHQFNIASQPVSSALNAIGRTAGLSVVINGRLPNGVHSQAVSGNFSSRQAISAALAGTGLTYSFTNANTVTVFDPNTGAQTGGFSADGETVQLETIEVAGGGGGRVSAADVPYETPGSTNYISGEQIARFRGTSAADMFRSTPGVLSGESRNSGAVDVNIRGVQGFGRVAVTVDGSQQSSHSSRGYQGAANRTYIDPDMIGGISIEKGPTLNPSAGGGAIGGLVAMRTLEADDILLPGKNFGVRVRGGLNTNSSEPPPVGTRGGISTATLITGPLINLAPGELPPPAPTTPTLPVAAPNPGLDRPGVLEPTGGNGNIALAGRSENFEFVAAMTKRKDGNYHAGTNGSAGEAVYTHSNINHQVAFNRYRVHDFYSYGGLSLFRAGEEVLNTSQDNFSALLKGKIEFGDGHEISAGYMYYESEFGAVWPSNLQRFYNVYQTELSNVKVDTYTSRYAWNPSGNDLIDFKANVWLTQQDEDLEVGTLGDYRRNVTSNERQGADISNTSRFSSAFGDFSWLYGGSYVKEEATPDDPTTLSPDWYGRFGERSEVSAFTNLEWSVNDWVTLDAGLRYTHFEAKNFAITEPGKQNSEDDGLAPSVGVTVSPFEGIQLFAKYAEGYRMASLYEGVNRVSTTLSPWVDLVPEHAKNVEAGLNFLRSDVLSDGDKAKFKAVYFNNNIDNYIARTYAFYEHPTIPNYSVPNAGTENIDYAHFSGVELSGSYDDGRVFAEAGFTWYDKIEFCNEGICSNSGASGADFAQNHIPPKYSASLTLGSRWFDDKLTVGSRILYVGERAGDVVDVNWTETTVWEPYALVDLFLDYKVNDHLALNIIAENIGDRFYIDPLGLAGVPGPGRTIRAGFASKF